MREPSTTSAGSSGRPLSSTEWTPPWMKSANTVEPGSLQLKVMTVLEMKPGSFWSSAPRRSSETS